MKGELPQLPLTQAQGDYLVPCANSYSTGPGLQNSSRVINNSPPPSLPLRFFYTQNTQMQTSLLLVFFRVETRGTDQGITFSPFVTRLEKTNMDGH